MYSFNSNAETSQDESSFINQHQNCKAIDRNTGELCGETESLRILDEFQKLYEARIENVEQEFVGEFERLSMKLQIMKEWIRDLGEQNTMLVHTVEDLEQTACSRVKLLEEKLKQSSTIVSRNITKSNHTEEAINLLSTRVSELEKDEEYMQQKVEFLQCDIRGLLEVIRRGTQENNWNLDGIAFFEIQPNDIPVPVNCTCGQEEIDNKLVQSLKLQIEELQENERKMIMYQTDLEKKLSDLTTKLTAKESKIETYVSQLQSFNDNLKQHSKTTDHAIYNSLGTNADQYPDIVTMGDAEIMLVEKGLEMESLKQQFQDIESNLMVSTYDSNVDLNSLKVQLSEKSKELEEVRQQMTNLQEECLEAQKALSTEVTEQHIQIMSLRKQVVTLKEECHCAALQIQFKEDIIKKMRKELKQATMKDIHISLRHDNENVCVNKSTFQEDYMIKCLNKIKFLMEKEKQAVLDLKMELRKVTEKLHFKEKEEGCQYDITRIYEKLEDIEVLIKNCKIQVNDYPESAEDFKKNISVIELQVNHLKTVFQSKSAECGTNTNDFDLNSIADMLNANIKRVTKMNFEKENILIMIDSLIHAQKNICSCDENVNNASNTNICQQFKLMKAYMSRFVAAQESRKSIKQKISEVISTFNSRHQKYNELNDKIIIMQEQLSKTWERIMKTISRLQLQENKRSRYEKRIVFGKIRLKDIKNEINHAQSRLSCCIADAEENMQDHTILNHTEICTCNDMLDLVIEEIEKISLSLNECQTQGCSSTSVLEELKDHLFDIEVSTKELRKTMDEALFEHTITETIFNEKEEQLKTFEIEDDVLHTDMHDTLKMLFSTTVHNQKLDEILQTQDLYTLKKEYDDLKQKLSQAPYADCDGKIYEWKNRMIDLQDQIKTLQHEVKCKEEANDLLKSSIELMEEELHSAQTKADNYRCSHSIDSMELKKKIVELENTIKTQRGTEHTLRQHLNESELELKQSREVLNSFHSDHGVEGILLRDGCNHFKHDAVNIPQLFKTLQNVMQSTKSGLQSLKDELKKMVCEGSPNSCLSTRLIMGLIDKLQKYEEELDSCTQDVDKLKDALYSKDKLLENMDEIIRIQKDSIAMTQTELKELHQRLQEKIDTQDRAITQYEAEKRELLKQNELQIQTIGHLQNAVVEAKRCIDQMGHKTMSDLQEKTETIRLLTIYVDETETQYSECFAEAAEQDKLLELQRDAISGLQEKICHMEHRTPIIISFLHNMYYSILTFIQEQLQARVNDFQALKCKIETLIQSKSCLENTYKNAKMSWRETEEKLQELMKIALNNKRETKVYDKACQCKVELKHKECMVQNTEFSFNGGLMFNTEEQIQNVSHEHELQSEIDTLIRENEDMKKQLQKWILDFDIIDEELKIEKKNDAYAEQIMDKLKIMKNTECALRFENDQLKFDLQKQTKEMEDLWGELQYVKEKNVKFEILLKKVEEKQIEINCLHNQITCNETVIRDQTETIQELEKRLKISKQQTENYLHQLNEGEEMLTILRDRIHSIKALFKEKSDNMAKLQADYETLKNDNSILRKEGIIYENKTKEELCKLKKKLKDVQLQLCLTEDSYHSVTQDFNKIQEQLLKAVKQEAHLQGSLTIAEENCNSKLMTAEKEKLKLGDIIAKLSKELEDTERNYSSKSSECCKLQDICKSYIQQIDVMQQHIAKEREKAIKVEESNRCLMQQLQECIKENCSLVQEKASIEQNNYKVTTELHDVYKSLLDLRKECLLKKKSLVSISADLTQIAISKSELCNESQYLVSCIRIWMEEQRKYMDNLVARLKFKQQRLLQLGFERKALLVTVKELRRVNNLLTQRLKRAFKPGKGVRSARTKCYFIPSTALQNFNIRVPVCPNSSRLQKVSRRTSVSGNPWWFPKMEYLVNVLRKNNVCHNKNSCGENIETPLEENRDCGYQSSTSK